MIVTDVDVVLKRKDVCYIKVKNARHALGELSSVFYNNPADSLAVYGITGTNGKTTTAYLMRHIFSSVGKPTGIITTVEYGIGDRSIPASRTTPEAPLLQSLLSQILLSQCVNAVMEVSSHALVQERVAGIDFDGAIFTNLTRDHLDYHKTRENYILAKKLLFSNIGRGRKQSFAVINIDDPVAPVMISAVEDRARVITYGTMGKGDVCAENTTLSERGSFFCIKTPWGNAEVKTKLLGRFNIYNILAALSACVASGVPIDKAVSSISTASPAPGRLQEIENNRNIKIFVDYAHTDDALENVLRTLREITKGRLIVVFGCGGNRDVTKRPAMGKIATEIADHTIVTSDNPRKEDPLKIIEDIKAGISPSSSFEIEPDRREAIKKAISIAKENDVIIVAGKGHETFQELANKTIYFDDRLVIDELLKNEKL